PQPNPEQVFTRLHGVRAAAATSVCRCSSLPAGDDQSLPRVNAVRAFKVIGLYDGLHADAVAQGNLAQRFAPGNDVSGRAGLCASGCGSKQEHCQQKQQNASAQQRIRPPDIDPVLTVHYAPLTWHCSRSRGSAACGGQGAHAAADASHYIADCPYREMGCSKYGASNMWNLNML